MGVTKHILFQESRFYSYLKYSEENVICISDGSVFPDYLEVAIDFVVAHGVG